MIQLIAAVVLVGGVVCSNAWFLRRQGTVLRRALGVHREQANADRQQFLDDLRKLIGSFHLLGNHRRRPPG